MSGAPEPPAIRVRPFRVLIVRVGAMGDVLHALAAVTALRQLHPEWQIDWAVEPRWRDLLVAPVVADPDVADPDVAGPGPIVDAAIAVRTRLWKQLGISLRTVRAILALRKTLRARRYDLCFDLQGSVRSAAIGWMAGARRLVGPEHPREAPARWFYREPVALSSVHVVKQAAELIEAVLGEPLNLQRPILPVDPAAEAWFATFAQDRLPPDARLVLLAPTAGWGAKEWPVAHFGELARQLAAAGFSVLVNADPTNSAQASAVARAGGERAEVVACTIAQLTALLRRTSLFVGGDTGPMHLADALGVPVVALFGPTDPARTGPRGPGSRTLRHPASITDHRRNPQTEPGLARITVEEVLRAARDLLDPREDAAG